MSECLHMRSFATSVPAVHRKGTWSGWGVRGVVVGWGEWRFTKWDINFKLLSLLFINSLLCAFSGLMYLSLAVWQWVMSSTHLCISFTGHTPCDVGFVKAYVSTQHWWPRAFTTLVHISFWLQAPCTFLGAQPTAHLEKKCSAVLNTSSITIR